MNYEKAVERIRTQLREYINKNNIQSLVIGISGGMDSCLCAALARPICDELRIPLIGRSLPMSTNKKDEIDRASITGEIFCTDFKEINLQNLFELTKLYTEDETSNYIDNSTRVSIRNGNLKARLRMIYLYNLASQNNGMVLSTDNYTEFLLGFWTLHGDVGDYGMIQELWKSEVYDMAEYLAVYELHGHDEKGVVISTINSVATDGLGVHSMGDLGQIMPDFVGNSRDGYRLVDDILTVWKGKDSPFLESKSDVEGDLTKEKIINKFLDTPVIQRHLRSEFKRNNPVNIKRSLITH